MSTELVSRQHTPSTAPVAMQQQTDALMTRARQIASAPKDMLPRHYQGNPGACLMAVDWADRNDVSIFEALGEVAFVHGRPVVSAVLQKKMAARHGYRTQVIASTETEATVAVHGPDDTETGRYTYTIAMADNLGINKGAVWKADPAHMLVKRATTRALEYYGPSELAPIMVEPGSPAAEVAEIVDESGQEPPHDAAAPGGDDAPTPPTADELRAAAKAKKISIAGLMRAAQDMHDVSGTLDDVAGNPDAAIDLADWIDQQ